MLLVAAAPAAGGTGSTAIWVAAIGVVSVLVGALVPELFKLVKPRAPGLTAAGVTADQVQALTDKVDAGTASLAATRAEVRGIKRLQEAMRDALERRDAAHRRELEAIRDDIQRHLWGDHGLHRAQPPSTGPIPVPREP
jgi:hypothetical protein